MITLYDVLNECCRESGCNIPAKKIRLGLGHLVAQRYRVLHPGAILPRVTSTEAVDVNGYPDEFKEAMRSLLLSFLAGQKDIVREIHEVEQRAIRNAIRSFDMDIKGEDAAVFQETLNKKRLDYDRKEEEKGMVRFHLRYQRPEDLISLGMDYFKGIVIRAQGAEGGSEMVRPELIRKRIPATKDGGSEK